MQGYIVGSTRTQFDGVQLTRIQKLVCRIFKITPMLKYFHSFEVTTCGNNPARINDLIMDKWENTWHVSKSDGTSMKLISLTAIPEVVKLNGKFIVLYTMSSEG